MTHAVAPLGASHPELSGADAQLSGRITGRARGGRDAEFAGRGAGTSIVLSAAAGQGRPVLAGGGEAVSARGNGETLEGERCQNGGGDGNGIAGDGGS